MTCPHHGASRDGAAGRAGHGGSEQPWCDCAVDRLTGTSRVTVTVPDMNDRKDLRLVAAHLHDIAGVIAVEIDPDTHAVRVDGVDDMRAVADAIGRAGFRVMAPTPR